ERQLRRRRDLAPDLRAGCGLRGLAADDALLRSDRGRRGRPPGRDVPATAAGAAAADRHARRGLGALHRDGLAAQPRPRGDGGRRHLLCCVPMAIPQAHLPAFCSDLGILASHGAAMLSVLLGTAFVSRQFWGWISDRMGGLNTVLVGSTCQIAAMSAFMFTQDEIGLFTVSAAFGLGFAGIIPAYILAIRQLFPASHPY